MRTGAWLYDLLMVPLAAVGALGALFTRRGRQRWGERVGTWHVPAGDFLWLHGASVGEIQGLLPLIPLLRERYPQYRILVTATSVTGLDRAASLADATAVLPFDCGLLLRRALRGIRVAAFIFGETELWPGLLGLLQRSAVPCSLVNGRLSHYSARGYRLARPILHEVIRGLHLVACDTDHSRDRFIELGAQPAVAVTMGNAKYDSAPSITTETERYNLRQKLFGDNDPVPLLVLGSMWPGEEAIWFEAVKAALSEGLPLRVVVVPRHLEKLSFFEKRLAEYQLGCRRWSEHRQTPSEPVVLVDVMGILESLYAISDGAFIGGSLVNVGGHNPLEAAAYGTPIAMGPHHRNVGSIIEELQERKACRIIRDAEEAQSFVRSVATRDGILSQEGARARELWLGTRGTAERLVNSIYVAEHARPLRFLGLRWLLAPIAACYGGITAFRNRLFDRSILCPTRLSIPVVCIGNLTAGGNGKTPLCRWLVQELTKRGVRPVILSRGYGGTQPGPVLLSSSADAHAVGDEPVLLARTSGVPVVVARDRVAGGRFIEEQKLGDLIVLDDGFQHRRLARVVDIICMDATAAEHVGEISEGGLLPFGRFREDRDEGFLRASHVVVMRRAIALSNDIDRARALAPLLPGTLPTFYAGISAIAVVPLGGGAPLAPQPVIAVSAIAAPGGFWRTLTASGFSLESRVAFGDHARHLTPRIHEIARRFPGVPLVCTEKDAVKISPQSDLPLYVARTEFEVERGAVLIDDIIARALHRMPSL